MKQSFTRRLFAIAVLLLALFTLTLVLIQNHEARQARLEVMDAKLDVYAKTFNTLYTQGLTEKAQQIMPQDMRVTVISEDGKVLYDNGVSAVEELDNHAQRPELLQSRYGSEGGTQIRHSSSTGKDYIYHARYFDNHYVRTALPYNAKTQRQLATTNYFTYISLILFLVLLGALYFVVRRYTQAIRRIREITRALAQDKPIDEHDIPSDELGDISRELMEIFNQKEEARQRIAQERSKLTRHFNLANVGIALFDKKGDKEYANSNFIQYAALLSGAPITEVKEILQDPKFAEINAFMEDKEALGNKLITIPYDGCIYNVTAIKAEDGTAELTIADVTEQQNSRILKQEMTGNVAHELRTPLTSIRAYLETVRSIDLNSDQSKDFIEKAYIQVMRLSEMLDDITLITKMDEPKGGGFTFGPVNLHDVFEEVKGAFAKQAEENESKIINSLANDLMIEGNHSLIYSIFKNLIENSLRYAGKGADLQLDCYHQDESYYYFAYHDTGKGVDESHFPRLFERFYRIDKGRTRGDGGTGLGLSIVRNAIAIHGGQVKAGRHAGGGLEILFTLKRQ